MAGRPTKAEQFERALLDQIERLDTRIARIKAQQAALRATLIENRIQKISYKGAIRKNSFNSIMVAKKVVDKLRNSSGEIQAQILYEASIKGNEDYPMPMSTFRSHLHRMKRDGVVVSGRVRGAYRLGPNAPKR